MAGFTEYSPDGRNTSTEDNIEEYPQAYMEEDIKQYPEAYAEYAQGANSPGEPNWNALPLTDQQEEFEETGKCYFWTGV